MRSNGIALVALQGVLAVCVIGAAEFVPPPRGAMLLVSITGMSAGAILARSLPAGALPVAAGPIPNSIIVRGERTRLSGRLISSGILVLAASDKMCGDRL